MRLLLILTVLIFFTESHLLGTSDEKRMLDDIYRLRADPSEISKVVDDSFYYVDCYNTSFNLSLFLMAFTELYEKQEIEVEVIDKFNFYIKTEMFNIGFERNETANGLMIVCAKAKKCNKKLKWQTIKRVLKNSKERNNSKLLLEDFSDNFRSFSFSGHMKRDKFIETFLYDPEYRIKGGLILSYIDSSKELVFQFKGKHFTIEFNAERKPENPHEFRLTRAKEIQCDIGWHTIRTAKINAKDLHKKLMEQEDTEKLKKLIDPKFIFYDCGHFKHDRDEYLEKDMFRTTLSNGIIEKVKISNQNVIYIVKSGGSTYSNVAYIVDDDQSTTNGEKLILLSSSQVN